MPPRPFHRIGNILLGDPQSLDYGPHAFDGSILERRQHDAPVLNHHFKTVNAGKISQYSLGEGELVLVGHDGQRRQGDFRRLWQFARWLGGHRTFLSTLEV